MRELSIFIDESGVFGPLEKHSPFYIVSFVLHDQSDDITSHLDKIHTGLMARGLDADPPIHTGPLINGLSASERDFLSTSKESAERALRKGYFKTMDAKGFGS